MVDKPQYCLERISSALEGVTGKIVYIDTINVWFARYPTTDFLKHISETCGWMIPGRKHMYRQPQWVRNIRIHQPSLATLYEIERWSNGRYLLNRVDPAIDFLVRNEKKDLPKLAYVFDEYLVKGWHKNQETNRFNTTQYSSKKRTVTKNIVRYFDRPCRHVSDSRNCYHLEIKTIGAGVVRRMGIQHIDDLAIFDPVNYLKSNVKLKTVSLPKLGREYMKVLIAEADDPRYDVRYRRIPWEKTYSKGGQAKPIVIDQFARAGRMLLHKFTHPEGHDQQGNFHVQSLMDKGTPEEKTALVNLCTDKIFDGATVVWPD